MSYPIVIDNVAFGIGDAVMYAWCLHSINFGHESPRVKIYPRGLRDVFELFNAGQWLEKDPSFPPDTANPPAKWESGVNGDRGWLRLWLDEWGFHGTKPVRPTNNLTTEEIAWANDHWNGLATTGLKAVLFPSYLYPVRSWPENYYARLAWLLKERGFRVGSIVPKYNPSHPYPFQWGGLNIRQMAAMIKTADILVGNESGPVHFASTLGTKAYCIYGPTTPEMIHGHTEGIVSIVQSADRVPCVGCNCEFDKGFRAWCDSGCFAITSLSPWDVLNKIEEANGIVPLMVSATSQYRPQEVSVHIGKKFIEALTSVIQDRQFTCVLETGTFDGRGSTAALAEALKPVNGNLISVECNKERAASAREFHGKNKNVYILHGLTLPRKNIPSMMDVLKTCNEAVEAGVVIDGRDQYAAATSYGIEVLCDGDDNLLSKAIAEHDPQLIFLDSAGHLGWAEWQEIEPLVKPGVVIALDDTNHIKHYKTVKRCKELGYKVLFESNERCGSAIFEVQ